MPGQTLRWEYLNSLYSALMFYHTQHEEPQVHEHHSTQKDYLAREGLSITEGLPSKRRTIYHRRTTKQEKDYLSQKDYLTRVHEESQVYIPSICSGPCLPKLPKPPDGGVYIAQTQPGTLLRSTLDIVIMEQQQRQTTSDYDTTI